MRHEQEKKTTITYNLHIAGRMNRSEWKKKIFGYTEYKVICIFS